jgi:hypothetical protein
MLAKYPGLFDPKPEKIFSKISNDPEDDIHDPKENYHALPKQKTLVTPTISNLIQSDKTKATDTAENIMQLEQTNAIIVTANNPIHSE